MDIKLIASRIKEIRSMNSMSQSQFGQALNVSQDTVSLWENGKSVPTTEFIVLIAQTFRISADYILGLTEY